MPRPTASASSPVSPPSLLSATFSEFGTRVPGASGEPQDGWRCPGRALFRVHHLPRVGDSRYQVRPSPTTTRPSLPRSALPSTKASSAERGEGGAFDCVRRRAAQLARVRRWLSLPAPRQRRCGHDWRLHAPHSKRRAVRSLSRHAADFVQHRQPPCRTGSSGSTRSTRYAADRHIRPAHSSSRRHGICTKGAPG
jgi:hypothetical protein